MVYAAHRVGTGVLGGQRAGANEQGEFPASLATELERACVELVAVSDRGDNPEATALALKVACAVLACPAVALAHEVMAGGPHVAAKGTELARRLLEGTCAALTNGSGSERD
jgi:hypothetical protein